MKDLWEVGMGLVMLLFLLTAAITIAFKIDSLFE